MIFLRRINIGIIVKHGNLEEFRQTLNTIRTAWSAAAVKKKLWNYPFPTIFSYHFFHSFLIINLIHNLKNMVPSQTSLEPHPYSSSSILYNDWKILLPVSVLKNSLKHLLCSDSPSSFSYKLTNISASTNILKSSSSI